MKIARKITTKEATGLTVKQIRKLAEEGKGAIVHVFRVAGNATDTKIVTSLMPDGKTSESLGLRGEFRAVSSTGQVMIAPIVYLPGNMTELVKAQLARDGVDVVTFAADVYVKEDESAATGYVYEVHTLIEPKEEDDPLQKLMATLPAPVKPVALPAPEQKKEPETETKNKK